MSPIISLFVSLMLSGSPAQQSALYLSGDQAEDKMALYHDGGDSYCDSELAHYREHTAYASDAAPDFQAPYND